MNELTPRNEREEQILTEGIRIGKEHSTPSPETRKFMEQINMQIDFIKEKLSQMPTRDEMDLANEKLIERVLNRCDERYAGKLVEKIVYGIVIMLLIGVAGIVGRMILQYLSAP